MRIGVALPFLAFLPRVYCSRGDQDQNPLGRLRQTKYAGGLEDLSFEAWLSREEKMALSRLLANIAPGGQNVQGVVPGTVIASPSREHPNYYYQWVRDAAITISTLVWIYAEDPSTSEKLDISNILNAYASLQYSLQHSNNPSGGFYTGGLGEPKFHVDGSSFTGSWGRPQHDGPALRALTLIDFLCAFNATDPALWSSTDPAVTNFFKSLYDASMPANSIIKADLEHVANSWRHVGFDLWEEVQGMHFFTAMVQMRALSGGIGVARAFSDEGAAAWYEKQYEIMKVFMKQFWEDGKGHLVATLGTFRSGLDCSILLGSLHGNRGLFDDGEESHLVYPPWSDEVLLSLFEFVIDQGDRHPVNRAASPLTPVLRGVGIGRYPGDVYDGDGMSRGNPWFLCTTSVSEVLYRSLFRLAQQEVLHVSERGLRFWNALSEGQITATGIYSIEDPLFNATLAALKRLGDSFLNVVKKHASSEGSLSEQFDGQTGFERGARDLTWSYGAFLEAVSARKKAESVLVR